MPVGHAHLLRTTAPGCTLTAGPWRALYVWKGGYSLSIASASPEKGSDGTGKALGRVAADLRELEAGSAAFIWEITGNGVDPPDVPRGTEMLAHYDMPHLPEDETAGETTLRFERVDLFPAVVTPRHTHRGSGLRILISGEIMAELDDRRLRLKPGDAWLEKGPGEAVVGRASATDPTAFVRLLVLPATCFEQDSFVFLDKGQGDRPKPAAYRRFHEERLVL